MTVTDQIHLADHWPTVDDAWKAGGEFIQGPESGRLGDFDILAKRHREGWVLRLETPASEGRTRILGYLTSDA